MSDNTSHGDAMFCITAYREALLDAFEYMDSLPSRAGPVTVAFDEYGIDAEMALKVDEVTIDVDFNDTLVKQDIRAPCRFSIKRSELGRAVEAIRVLSHDGDIIEWCGDVDGSKLFLEDIGYEIKHTEYMREEFTIGRTVAIVVLSEARLQRMARAFFNSCSLSALDNAVINIELDTISDKGVAHLFNDNLTFRIPADWVDATRVSDNQTWAVPLWILTRAGEDAAHSVEISLHDDKHVSVGFYTTKDTGVYFYAGGASAAAKQQTA